MNRCDDEVRSKDEEGQQSRAKHKNNRGVCLQAKEHIPDVGDDDPTSWGETHRHGCHCRLFPLLCRRHSLYCFLPSTKPAGINSVAAAANEYTPCARDVSRPLKRFKMQS